ncbi:MAG: preprotein translocase subunit Sec61beta [Candidatus Diapherotrites archaeon]|uniref:Preprotein translocase subunit Sec61beta n=1 Tax=Candidatus Iainarchaeum sp. TaxID=3101447 RepID=A0A2D6M219_9ARCH|nr:preprotein translocase subunit Sec61beta [Candidatus Diapherotrites archaeon]|tara:strand:- start:2412 stop:2585 length:174 start_codon:yes stop_codon:yes gene_type:complete
MVKLKRGPTTTGPSSSLGIMRFFDADTAGPKLSPEFVVIIAVALIAVVVAAKLLLGF